jgi:hypothetical protein
VPASQVTLTCDECGQELKRRARPGRRRPGAGTASDAPKRYAHIGVTRGTSSAGLLRLAFAAPSPRRPIDDRRRRPLHNIIRCDSPPPRTAPRPGPHRFSAKSKLAGHPVHRPVLGAQRNARTIRTAAAFSCGLYRRYVGFPGTCSFDMTPSSFPRSGAPDISRMLLYRVKGLSGLDVPRRGFGIAAA